MEEQDEAQTESYISKSSFSRISFKKFRPFYSLFSIIGVDINFQNPDKKLSVCKWLYLSVLLISALLPLCVYFYTIFSSPHLNSIYEYFSVVERVLILILLYVIVTRRQKFCSIIVDIGRILSETCTNSTYIENSLRHCAWFCVILIFIDFVVKMIQFIQFVLPLVHEKTQVPLDLFAYIFCGIESKNQLLINLQCLLSSKDVVSTFEQIFFDIFSVFLIFIFFLFGGCFKQLNLRHEMLAKHYSPMSFMIDHGRVSELTKTFGQQYSLALLIFVAFIFIYIMDMVDQIIVYVKKEDVFDLWFSGCQMLRFITKFVALSLLGQRIKRLAQDGIKAMLESSMDNRNDTGTHNNYQITAPLFSVHLTAAPVVISPYNLINIDCNLITLVMGMTITYLSLMAYIRTPIEDPLDKWHPSHSNSSDALKEIFKNLQNSTFKEITLKFKM